MKDSVNKSYNEFPLFLNAKTVARALGVSPSSGYELMHQQDFPWVERNTSGGDDDGGSDV